MDRRVLRGAMALAVAAAALAAAASGPAAAPPASLDLLERPAPATVHGARRLLLGVAPGGPGLVAVGEMGLLLTSGDGGQTWQQQASPSSVLLTAVHFPQARLGWAVGHDGVILATADGGRSWRRQFDGRQANTAMLRAAQEELAAAQAAVPRNAGRLAQAEEQLAAAQDAIKAGPSRPLLAVHFADAKRGYVAGAFGQLFATDNGGAEWRYIGNRLPNPEGLHLNSLGAGAPGALYIAAEQGVVFISTDGGASWRRSETGYGGHLYGVTPLTGPDGREQLLAYGFSGHLFRSGDRGATWSELPRAAGAKTWVQAVALAGALWLLAEDGRLFVSRDSGDTLKPAGPGRVVARRVAGFAFAENGRRLVAVGQGGVGLHTLDTRSP